MRTDMEWSTYIKPELLILIPVLFLLGRAIKKSSISDWKIPLLLAAAGTLLSGAYLLSVSMPDGTSGVFSLIFSSITQGVLAAAGAVYSKNLITQIAKKDGEDGNEDV